MDKNELLDNLDKSKLMDLSLTDWHTRLKEECQVYCCEGGYLGKRLDEINYKFCGFEEAKQLIIDNCYIILLHKYIRHPNDEQLEKITKIVNSFVVNLQSKLIKISFKKTCAQEKIVKYLPDYCIACRNGVYDFKEDKWFFKYTIIEAKEITRNLYYYDNQYIISWYMDYDFEPLPISIMSNTIEQFVDLMKETTKENKNYCFELMYNMCHDKQDIFQMDKFKHLCQILGYTCLQSFTQHFVILIGTGQNGKNSLIDGCFTNLLYPKHSTIDLDTIENDRFVTGALENKSHNICLEMDAKTFKKSTMLKLLTGSMYQSVEDKGVSKHSSIINCKYVFAGNDKSDTKFGDNSEGLRRRINLFEIFYKWDKNKRFLNDGDYYDTTFSNSLKEITNDISNTTIFLYFAMFGISLGTKKFKEDFTFKYNEWSDNFAEIDTELRDRILNISSEDIIKYAYKNRNNDSGNMFFNSNKMNLKRAICINSKKSYQENIEILYNNLFKENSYEEIENPDGTMNKECYSPYIDSINLIEENVLYVSIEAIKDLAGMEYGMSKTKFTQSLLKTFSINKPNYNIYANKPFVQILFNSKSHKIYNII